MKNYASLLSIVFVLLLSGCAATVQMADKEHDRQAKTFTTKANMSNIYIYAEHGFEAGAVTWKLTLDGLAVGEINNGSYIQLEVPPGSHTLSSLGDMMLASRGEQFVSVDTEAGENHFFWHNVNGSNYFHKVVEATGKKGVSGCNLVFVPESVNQQIAAESKRREKKLQEAAIQRNFARPDKITAPSPIAGNSGKYRSPYTAAGTVALWAQKPVAETDNGSDLAASVGGAVGQQVTQKALDFVPFGLGGMIGQKAGESAARAATKKNIEPELPGMDAVSASSDISFNSADELAVYMYAKHSAHGQYARVLALAQRVYPELQDAYTSAIEKASQASDSRKEKSPKERLDALKDMKDSGSISESDYQAKKSEILKSL